MEEDLETTCQTMNEGLSLLQDPPHDIRAKVINLLEDFLPPSESKSATPEVSPRLQRVILQTFLLQNPREDQLATLHQMLYDGLRNQFWNTEDPVLYNLLLCLLAALQSVPFHDVSPTIVKKICVQATDGYQTSIPIVHVQSVIDWYKEYRPFDVIELPGESLLSTIENPPKRKPIRDTFISTTPVSSMPAIADVKESEQRSSKRKKDESEVEVVTSDDSDVEIEDGEFTLKTFAGNTGVTGCNITLNKGDKSYTWKSTKCPTYKRYLDIKLYNDVRALKKEKDGSQHWRLAQFRAKIALGNPMKPEQWKRTKEALTNLVNVIQEHADQIPGVKKESQVRFGKK